MIDRQPAVAGITPPTTQDHSHSSHAGDEPVCLVPSTARTLLDFTEAPSHTLRIPYFADVITGITTNAMVGITTIASPVLDIAALYLRLTPNNTQMLRQQSNSEQLTYMSADSNLM